MVSSVANVVKVVRPKTTQRRPVSLVALGDD
jgi:hypothetical protein